MAPSDTHLLQRHSWVLLLTSFVWDQAGGIGSHCCSYQHRPGFSVRANWQNVIFFCHCDFRLILLKRMCTFFLACLCSRLNIQFAHQTGQSLTYCKLLSVLSSIFVLLNGVWLCNHCSFQQVGKTSSSVEVSDGACHLVLYPFPFQEHCSLDKEVWN